MFCCRGNKKSVSTPGVSQETPKGILLRQKTLVSKRGAADDKAGVTFKEPSVPVSAEAAVVTTEKQHVPQETQEAQVSSDTICGTNDFDHSAQEKETDQTLHGHTDTASSGTHAAGLLRKQRTVVVNKNELDLMVVEYSCHDSSVLTALGKHSKEARWKVQMGCDLDPVVIKLHVDKGVASGPAVHVTSNETTVFKTAGGYTRKAMYEDFEERWPFRGSIKGMNEPGMFEFHPRASGAANQWFPATIIGQRLNGDFEVLAMMPDNLGGFKQESFPAVSKSDLREAGTQKPLEIPERCLTLQVPRDDPLQACLTVDGQDLVTHHFARPSPTPASDNHGQKKRLELCVDKDRSIVTGNVGLAVLSHFVSGEVRSITSDIEWQKHTWTIQIGPFAKHTIAVQKKHTFGKVISLTVDGEHFVEATAEDIDCHTGGWECEFRFVGERIIDFEVHETNRDGMPLESKARVVQKRKYAHKCCVKVGEDMDLRTATLTVDSQDFRRLPVQPELHDEANLSISPKALNDEYEIIVPYHVNPTAPSGILGCCAPQSAQKGRRVRTICC